MESCESSRACHPALDAGSSIVAPFTGSRVKPGMTNTSLSIEIALKPSVPIAHALTSTYFALKLLPERPL
ncbi:MAG: hypothetical protein JKY15_03595 [Deltaproteobacteria bacterium]|nr:hypothetical protein [Deltaproteobacteria bacterium]